MFRITDRIVSFDHPVQAIAEHTLSTDFANLADGPSAQVAVELTAAVARELAAAIHARSSQPPPC